MHFTIADVRRCFESRTFERGVLYARAGNVLQFHVDERTGDISASVRGSTLVPYEVTVRVEASRRGPLISGFCDCPIEHNCKHAVATALVAAQPVVRKPMSSPIAVQRAYDPTDVAVNAWLSDLDAYRSEPGASGIRGQHLRYILDIPERYETPHVMVEARVVTRLKGGELNVGRPIEIRNLALAVSDYVQRTDRTIGRLMSAAQPGYGRSLSPTLFAVLLDQVIQTGRAHWHSTKSPPLVRKDIGLQRLEWRVGDDARLRPVIEGRASARLLPSSPSWYLDPVHNEAGAIDLGVAPELAAKLAVAPALSREQAERVQPVFRRVFGSNGVPAPPARVKTEIVEDDPTPVLHLRAFAPTPETHGAMEPLAAVAELTFAYGDTTVVPSDPAREFRRVTGEHVHIRVRRWEFESAARSALDAGGLVPISWPHVQFVDRAATILRFPGSKDRQWAQFVDVVVPRLREQGWRVEIESSFPFEIVHVDGWDAEIVENENRWFELDLGIDVDGTRLALLPIVVDALRALGVRSAEDLTQNGNDMPVYGRLPNGAFVALPAERVTQILSSLVELYDTPLTEEGRLTLTPVHIASIERLEVTTPVRWAKAAPLRALLGALADEGLLDSVTLPSTFQGELRPYQARGVAWLQLLRRNGFGGVLADDMGLGKTVQFLAHVTIEESAKRLRGPVLIVAPTSVVPNWQAEIARFAPHLKVLALTGPDRGERFASIQRSDIVLTTYPLLQRDVEHLAQPEWQLVALDEAQAIKNPRSKGALAAGRLRAQQRLALTGTPMENHLDELWSVFSFAMPGLLGDRTSFGRVFRTPIEKRGDADRRALLAARLRPFLLRRTKENVALDLPEKTEIVVRVELSGAQRDLYETIRVAMHERVRKEMQQRGLARSHIIVLDALLKLRQICCDPRLLKIAAARRVYESQKLEALLDMLPELVEEGRRVLLFSQFTSMLDLIKPELDSRKIAYVEIRGETKDRTTPVQRFQAGEVPLFLISLKAGGTGLNLTAADTVIHYDPWWNPAVERQATDRAHRIGQHNPVFVYKLITTGTVEERILEMQQRKADLAAALFDESAAAKLTSDDIERLFAPL